MVVTQDPNLGKALQVALGLDESAILTAGSVAQAVQALAPGPTRWIVIDAARADANFLADVQAARGAGFTRIAGLVAERSPQWEEKAIIGGASYFFERPIRGALWKALVVGRAESSSPPPARPERPQEPAMEGQIRRSHAVSAMLEYTQLMREVVSGELLDSFMERLRRILGATKCLLFLQNDESKVWLTCAYHAGVSGELAGNIRISLNEGLGLLVRQKGCIVRRKWAAHQAGEDALGEMEILQADYAIPVHDKETVRGVLLLGGSVLGEPLGEEALQVIYHLLEELASALAIRKLIEDNRRESEFLRGMLDATGEAVIAIDDALEVKYCNKRARALLFGGAEGKPSFHDLPRELASAIYATRKGKKERVVGRLQVKGASEIRSYSTNILPGSVVIAKIAEQGDRIDAEGAGDAQRLMRRLGRQLSNELRNGLTSVTTCAQLLAQNAAAPSDIKEMGEIMRRDVQRLGRLADNLFILSRSHMEFGEVLKLDRLLKAAWAKAVENSGGVPYKLEETGDASEISISCDQKALDIALSEIFLNAIQAGAVESTRAVSCSVRHHDGIVSLLIRGPGPWPADRRIGEPFFSTKAVGVGLGLTVARKVITDHGGTLTLDPEKGVGIDLPTEED
jgi:two-component system sensor histidine kinase FlrB